MRIAAVFLLMGGCWHDAVPDPVGRSLVAPKSTLPHVAAAEFGTFDDMSGFAKTQVISLREGVGYGWRIRVPCTEMTAFRETLKMPSPGDWHVDIKSRISADRTTVTTTDAATCLNGWVKHSWYASPGDPDGVYTITVEIDGFTPVRFHPRFTR